MTVALQKFEIFASIAIIHCVFSVALIAANATDTSTSIAQVSDAQNKNDSVVYTYSEAIVRDGKPIVSQLTIAKGKDGKYHYARNENGTTKVGIWEGPLPSTPDVSNILGESLASVDDLTKQLDNPLADLNIGIGNTLQNYLQNAFNL